MPASTTWILIQSNGGNLRASTGAAAPSGSPAGYTFAYDQTPIPSPGNFDAYTVRILNDGTWTGAPSGQEILRIEFLGGRINQLFGGSFNGDNTFPTQWYGRFTGNAVLYMPRDSLFLR
jgi:hypothetical protein